MREQPTADQLLDAVAAFLRQDIMPQLTGGSAFHARIAANVVDIVRRELTSGSAAATEEAARLKTLLGAEGDLESLNCELCKRIAKGVITLEDPALIDHLWLTTLDTVSVDQPTYATYRRATANPQASAKR